MTRAISIRLDADLLTFIDAMPNISTRSDKIRGVLLWLKEYQAHYLTSINEYIISCMTKESQAP